MAQQPLGIGNGPLIGALLFVQLSPANNLELQYGFHNAAMQAIAD